MRKEVAPAVARWRGAKETRKERRGAAAKTEREEKRERERERERRREGALLFSVFLVRWPRREGVRELSYSSSSSSASWAVTSTSSIEASPR